MCTGGEQERHRHRIEDGNKRQSKQADRSLEVGGRRTHQLGEISQWAHVRLGTPALGVNLGFLDLQATEGRYLALTLCDDVGALAALLVGESSSPQWGGQAGSIPQWPRRFGRYADRGLRPSGPGY